MGAGVQEDPRGWVPVEHRWFGLDRRTFGPALITLVVALVLIYGLPALNAAIPWHNEIRAGDVLDLGGGATAVPPIGWQLEDGTLTGGPRVNASGSHVLLATGGATIELRGTAFTGTARAFLDQVGRADGDRGPSVVGEPGTLTTDAGLVGVVLSTTGPGGDGVDAAFKMATGDAVDEAPALLVRVQAAPDQFERHRDQVTALLRSVTPGVER